LEETLIGNFTQFMRTTARSEC